MYIVNLCIARLKKPRGIMALVKVRIVRWESCSLGVKKLSGSHDFRGNLKKIVYWSMITCQPGVYKWVSVSCHWIPPKSIHCRGTAMVHLIAVKLPTQCNLNRMKKSRNSRCNVATTNIIIKYDQMYRPAISWQSCWRTYMLLLNHIVYE